MTATLRNAIRDIADEFASLARMTCRNCAAETAHCELKTHDGQCMACHQHLS